MQTDKHLYVAIMAGGVGSRFWPGSREARPKQFLDMLGVGKSLLRLTFERFQAICPTANILVVTNTMYKSQVQAQLPELADNQVLCEPSRNNTAPCIAYAAFRLRAADPKATLIVAPSDHVVLRPDAFSERVLTAVDFARQHGGLVTLGIQPSRPDTGYGYIQSGEALEGGIHKVLRFTEKPDLATAQRFLKEGHYLWNAGIFVWTVGDLLDAFDRYTPNIPAIFNKGIGLYGTPAEQAFIDEHYPTTPNISIDYAILEKADNVYTLPSEFGWSDLGTWASLHAECPKDENDNVIQGHKVIALDVDNCLVRVPNEKLVVIKDLHDYIVVDEGDVLLIYPKSKEQEIKQVTATVREMYGAQYL